MAKMTVDVPLCCSAGVCSAVNGCSDVRRQKWLRWIEQFSPMRRFTCDRPCGFRLRCGDQLEPSNVPTWPASINRAMVAPLDHISRRVACLSSTVKMPAALERARDQAAQRRRPTHDFPRDPKPTPRFPGGDPQKCAYGKCQSFRPAVRRPLLCGRKMKDSVM